MRIGSGQKIKIYMMTIFFAVLLFPCRIFAEVLPKPVFSGYVYDYANVINAIDKGLINTYAESINSMSAGTVIVVTVESLNNMSSLDYGTQLFDEWGIGSSELNDGLLILLAPYERHIQMITGSGVESQMTGEICGELIDTYAIDKLAANQFSAGIRDLAKAACLKMALMRSPLLDDLQLICDVQSL